MSKTNIEKLLDYLWSIAPKGASNADIREAIGSQSHQSVYMLTKDLKGQGVINAERKGREWFFYVNESATAKLTSPGPARSGQIFYGKLSPHEFEKLARKVMRDHFGMTFSEREVPGVPKRFDMVSENGRFIGDAKYYTLVDGKRLPPAKFSVIAEHVWLLGKTNAATKFLVFGNDMEVPRLWLSRYTALVDDVAFFFLSDEGDLTQLK